MPQASVGGKRKKLAGSSRRQIVKPHDEDYSSSDTRLVRVGSRGSPLALAQAKIVVDLLRKSESRRLPRARFEIQVIRTEGDRPPNKRSTQYTGKDTFTGAIDKALLEGRIDIAVHSLKDVPVDEFDSKRIEIAAYPRRASPYDVLIGRETPNGKVTTLADLPPQSKIGTSSLRRAIQLKAFRRDFEIVQLHGNVQTRINKLLDSDLDAIVLARAGLERLGESRGQTLPKKIMLPAIGQGCLAVETRKNDEFAKSLVSKIDDRNTRLAVSAERAFSREFGGGCNFPIAAIATISKRRGRKNERLVLEGAIGTPDENGFPSNLIRRKTGGPKGQAESLGMELARKIMEARHAQNPKNSVTATSLRKSDVKPLSGRTVLITRTAEGNAVERSKLEKLGAKVIEIPTIKIVPPSSSRVLDEAISMLEEFDWLVFTSTNGVDMFFDRLTQQEKTAGELRSAIENTGKPQFACVGPSTRKTLESLGFKCTLEPEESTTRELGYSLARFDRDIQNKKILLARAEIANDELVQILKSACRNLVVAPTYKTVPIEMNQKRVGEVLDSATDVTFTSPSTVNAFLRSIPASAFRAARIHCIGPVTANAAKQAGLKVDSIAKTHTIQGMIEALSNCATDRLPQTMEEIKI